MKKLVLFILCLFICSFFSLNAQDCPPDDVTLLTQADVDDYVANFPNCTTINGNLRIGPSSNSVTGVTDISGLSMLTHITGNLRIIETTQLSNLNGLEQLEEIGGSLIFDLLWQNALDISALDHPITIGGIIYFDLSYNVGPCTVQAICDHYLLSPDNVVSNSGSSCGSLGLICQPPSECPPGDVTINSQADMDYFAATYPNCTVINGDFRFVGDFELQIYPTITVPGLPALERIEGRLSFTTYTDMTNGFTGLTYVGGSLGSGIDLDGAFPALDTIGGDFYNDGDNPSVTSSLTASFPALRYVGGGFRTQGSEGGYIDSDGFPVLERIEGGIYDCTEYSPGLTLSGFPALKYIGGDIEVEIGVISGMNMVDTIAGSVTFRRCDFISVGVAITGLNELDYVGGGGFNFGWKHCVSDLSGLCNYFSNGGSLSISESGDDCSISEAEALLPCTVCPAGGVILTTQQEVDEFSTTYPLCNRINGDLTIAEASPGSITNLNGLNQLDTIYGGIYIYNNEVLADISGLENVVYSEMTNLEIYDNAGLSTCSLFNLCNYLAVGGVSNIYNNLAGCDSVQDIQANCSECPPGDVELFSQQDITGLIALYPNCTTINGDLSIQYNVNDISLLSQLTTINGSLIIQNNNNLTSLAGLENITSVGVELAIFSNNNLTSLTGLENITSVGIELTIFSNDNLTSLAGLENIALIGVDLTISANYNLTSLMGLENITSIGGQLVIIDNSQLTSLEGLENITSIGKYLWISGGNMTNLNGLNNLTSIGEDLTISDNYALVNLIGLDSLTSINGKLEIKDNNNLVSLTGLGNIDYSGIDYMRIYNNPNLSTCEVFTVCNYINNGGGIFLNSNATGCNNVTQIGNACAYTTCPTGDLTFTTQQQVDNFENIPNCTNIPGNLSIQATTPNAITNLDGLSQMTNIEGWLLIEGTSVANLDGLSNLTSIDNALVIKDNPALTDLSGLGNMTTLPSNLSIENNDALIDLSGLENMSQISGSLLISDNTALQNLSGLEGVTNISSQLYVSDNAALTNFSGLENLTSIGTNIRLQNNASLNTLTAFSNVNTLDGYIRVSGHNTLTSLDGLDNIDPNSITDLILTNNPNLAVCNQESICSYLENGGTATINNNASGCNSAVETACFVPISSPEDTPTINFFPNPNFGKFEVKGITQGTYQIHDTQGRIIQEGMLTIDSLIDISEAVQGVYFISIYIDNQIYTEKIIKM